MKVVKFSYIRNLFDVHVTGTGSSRFGKGLKIAIGEYNNKNPIFSFDDDDVDDNDDDHFLLQPYQQLWQR
jgi:hypothetical protein